MTASNDPRLAAALDKWRGWSEGPPCRPQVLTRLGSTSAVNSTFLLGAGDWRAVLKLRGDAGPRFQRDWNAERELSRFAADSGIGPALLHVDDSAGSMLIEWVAPVPLPDECVLARQLARCLATVHTHPVTLPRRDYRSEARRYRDGIRLALQSIPARFAAWIDAAVDAADRLARDAHWSATHHDISAENLLWNGAQLLLVDWEYGCLAHPAFDLVCAEQLVLQEPRSQSIFRELYFAHTGWQISEQTHADALQLFRFYAIAWQSELAIRQNRELTFAELSRLVGPEALLC